MTTRTSRALLATRIAILIGSTFSLAQAADVPLHSSLDQELAERELAQLAAPVKSEADLALYKAHERYRGTPLETMPAASRQRFLGSLVFHESGLASFDYTDLRNHLSAGEIYEVLAIFGAQRSASAIPGYVERAEASGVRPPVDDGELPVDYSDMVCSARASCTPWPGGVCIGNNC